MTDFVQILEIFHNNVTRVLFGLALVVTLDLSVVSVDRAAGYILD